MGKGKRILHTLLIAMAAFAIGALLKPLPTVARRYSTIDLKPVVSPVESPARAAQPLDVPRRFAQEQGNSSAPYVDVANPYEFEAVVKNAYWATKNAVDAAGTDRQVNCQDLEWIAEQAYPHIMRELNLKKINRPKLTCRFEAPPVLDERGEYSFAENTVTVYFADEVSRYLSVAKFVTGHELGHAQQRASVTDIYLMYLSRGRLIASNAPLNEVVASLVSLEVAAAQALKGDKFAQLGFFIALYEFSTAAKDHADGKKLSIYDTYNLETYGAVKAALLGESDTHRGVKLDSTVKLLKEMAF